ncbi:MAG: 5-oxoprolinase subunit PxpA [Anaerolineae bacterium]|nr:5-oxoprolinase subunit PxpA [Anaerolineae bacterium]
MRVDLNGDIGESFGRYTLGDDVAILDVLTSANIACGMHAGDPAVMSRTVTLATWKNVAIGAHPGYPDLQGFGRRAMSFPPETLEAYVLYQVGALAGFAQAAGNKLRHVKLHGALYNQAAADGDMAAAIAKTIAAYNNHLIMVTLPGSMLSLAARGMGLRVAHEGFPDRAYRENGSLVPRNEPGAVIHDTAKVTARALRMVTRNEVETINGRIIPIKIDTLCVHGDTPNAVGIATTLRAALEANGVVVKAFDA